MASETLLLQQFEGQLFKYTNVMKGWQNRYFVLDPEKGTLYYFLGEIPPDGEQKQHPRGSIRLSGASIAPSGDDSNSFTLHTAAGDTYQLRAVDARQRQEWVMRMRAVAQGHAPEAVLPVQGCQVDEQPKLRQRKMTKDEKAKQSSSDLHVLDTFYAACDQIGTTEQKIDKLTRAIEDLPMSGPVTHTDTDLLLLKATSLASQRCLVDCFDILKGQRSPATNRNYGHLPAVLKSSIQSSQDREQRQGFGKSREVLVPGGSEKNLSQQVSTHGKNSSMSPNEPRYKASKKDLTEEKFLKQVSSQSKDIVSPEESASVLKARERKLSREVSSLSKKSSQPSEAPSASLSSTSRSEPRVECQQCQSVDEYVTDDEAKTDEATPPSDEERYVIVHMMAQLKLGMDLTKVTLPAFLLDGRSLLEVFADCMGHPDFFPRIADGDSPRARMTSVLEWYLTSFHAFRRGARVGAAKKPYNPLAGETFHCSWRLPPGIDNNTARVVRYVAEQVSHHPPVTAFYVECPETQICVNASVRTKSNYSGMNFGVNMIGEISMHVGKHQERYDFSLPSVFVKSVTSIPSMELRGKVVIACPRSGYSANVVFNTRPMYGGKENEVTANLKDAAGVRVCQVTGDWEDSLEFVYDTGETVWMNVRELPVVAKRVRKVSAQGEFESRRLWGKVTQALRKGEVELATQEKKALEERQRGEEKKRREQGKEIKVVHFHKDGDKWVYNKPLLKIS